MSNCGDNIFVAAKDDGDDGGEEEEEGETKGKKKKKKQNLTKRQNFNETKGKSLVKIHLAL